MKELNEKELMVVDGGIAPGPDGESCVILPDPVEKAKKVVETIRSIF